MAQCIIPYGKPNMNCHFTYVTVFLNCDHCICFKGFVWSQTRQVNQVGRFREYNGDIARLCLQKQRFSSPLCLQIVTIFSTNSNENSGFFKFFPFGWPLKTPFPSGLVQVGLWLMCMPYKQTQTMKQTGKIA